MWCLIRTPAASGQKSRLSLSAAAADLAGSPGADSPITQAGGTRDATEALPPQPASAVALRAPNNTPADSAGECALPVLITRLMQLPLSHGMMLGAHAHARVSLVLLACRCACACGKIIPNVRPTCSAGGAAGQPPLDPLRLAAQLAHAAQGRSLCSGDNNSGGSCTASLATAEAREMTVDIPAAFFAASPAASQARLDLTAAAQEAADLDMHAVAEQGTGPGLLSQASVASAAAAAAVVDVAALQAQLEAAAGRGQEQETRVNSHSFYQMLFLTMPATACSQSASPQPGQSDC